MHNFRVGPRNLPTSRCMSTRNREGDCRKAEQNLNIRAYEESSPTVIAWVRSQDLERTACETESEVQVQNKELLDKRQSGDAQTRVCVCVCVRFLWHVDWISVHNRMGNVPRRIFPSSVLHHEENRLPTEHRERCLMLCKWLHPMLCEFQLIEWQVWSMVYNVHVCRSGPSLRTSRD